MVKNKYVRLADDKEKAKSLSGEFVNLAKKYEELNK